MCFFISDILPCDNIRHVQRPRGLTRPIELHWTSTQADTASGRQGQLARYGEEILALIFFFFISSFISNRFAFLACVLAISS